MDANECRLCVYLVERDAAHIITFSTLFCANTFNEFPNGSCVLDSLDSAQKHSVLLGCGLDD